MSIYLFFSKVLKTFHLNPLTMYEVKLNGVFNVAIRNYSLDKFFDVSKKSIFELNWTISHSLPHPPISTSSSFHSLISHCNHFHSHTFTEFNSHRMNNCRKEYRFVKPSSRNQFFLISPIQIFTMNIVFTVGVSRYLIAVGSLSKSHRRHHFLCHHHWSSTDHQ